MSAIEQATTEAAAIERATVPHRTFKGTVSCDFKLVVADQFIQELRTHALTDEASVSLKYFNERHPKDDEAFVEAVLANGLRVHYRNSAAELIGKTQGVGGSLSPATVSIIGVVPDHAAEARPQVLHVRDNVSHEGGAA